MVTKLDVGVVVAAVVTAKTFLHAQKETYAINFQKMRLKLESEADMCAFIQKYSGTSRDFGDMVTTAALFVIIMIIKFIWNVPFLCKRSIN